MDIDRPKTAALGVPFSDVNQTLGIYLGSLYVNSFNAFGRHWQVTAQAEGKYRDQVPDINLLEVRNNQGQMVPLGTLGRRARDRRADFRLPLQLPHGSLDHRQLAARGQLRRGDCRRRSHGRPRRCRCR